MKTIPIQTTGDGCAKCIKAFYEHMGFTNFVRELGGGQDGFSVTSIMEIYEDDNCI